MMSAIQIETDSQNTHMLLGGLLLCVQDSVNFEDSDGGSDAQSTSARDTNLLSSGKSTFFNLVAKNSVAKKPPFLFILRNAFFYVFYKFRHQPFHQTKIQISITHHQHVQSVVLIPSPAVLLIQAMEIRVRQQWAMSQRAWCRTTWCQRILRPALMVTKMIQSISLCSRKLIFPLTIACLILCLI